MAIGPGIYDDLCSQVREKAKAKGVLLIVLGGEKGMGFSAQIPLEAASIIPLILRDVANQIEADYKTQMKQN